MEILVLQRFFPVKRTRGWRHLGDTLAGTAAALTGSLIFINVAQWTKKAKLI